MLMIISACILICSLILLACSVQPEVLSSRRGGMLVLCALLQSTVCVLLFQSFIESGFFEHSLWLLWAAFALLVLIDFLVLILCQKITLPSSLLRFSESVSSLPSKLFEQPEAQEDQLEKLLVSTPETEDVETLEVAENALVLNETTLDEICTHRSDMVSLSLKDDPARWKQIILNNRHTFYPVTNESEDDVVGVLDTRDYFRLNGFGKKNILEKTVDKPFFVAENTTADELLRKMKQRRTYMAVVLDEYGGVVGLVTLHDIVEELFGDMSEEDQKKQADIVRLPKGVWRINGEADLEDVSKALGHHLELDDFETFSGYILGTLGYIPEDGSQFETVIGPLNIQIRKVEGHRIRQTLVRILPEEETPVPAAGQSPEQK